MALKLPMPEVTGISPEYLKITGCNVDYENEVVNISIALYISAAVRQTEGSKPVRSIGAQVVLPVDRIVSRAAIYTAIKLLDEFAGAEDC